VELKKALDEYINRSVKNLPRNNGCVTAILDAFESTRGYGKREFCCISQSSALIIRSYTFCHPGEKVTSNMGNNTFFSPESKKILCFFMLSCINIFLG